MCFPVDLSKYKPQEFSLENKTLNNEQKEVLKSNIDLIREAIVFMTALSNKKGVGGHTGGAYDIVPELMIIEGFINGNNNIYPVHFDDAGHRVAVQYVMAAIKGHISQEQLMHYREYDSNLPGHPEQDITPGIEFSSGRLGHIWSYLNGLAIANPDKAIIMYSSDGAQQEGNNSEAARFAVAKNLNIKVLIDDNNVTIAGHPEEYIKGFDLEKTLKGHGLITNTGDGEDLDQLYSRINEALSNDKPTALINKRKMSIGISGVEGKPIGHDAIPFKEASEWLKEKNNTKALELLTKQEKTVKQIKYRGSTEEYKPNRKIFGEAVCKILSTMSEEERKERVLAIDSDLAGSCGLSTIEKNYPEIYIQSGIMERNNFSAAAGFGSRKNAHGIFSTFAAFQEMIISEIVMARLNDANVISHFSHSGVDDMSDNTCHFGLNNFFAHNALPEDDKTMLYYPADPLQMEAVVEAIFNNPGLRFIYSTRSPVPYILNEQNEKFFSPENYKFTGKDEIIREGKDGYIVTYGEMLYRTLDAVEELKTRGHSIGLINKPCLNTIDEDMINKAGKSPIVIVIESQNINTGLGIRYGSWLLERGLTPTYKHFGSTKPGNCGMNEQITYQQLDPASIADRIENLLK